MPSGGQPKDVEAERTEGLEGVVGVVQDEWAGGSGVVGLCFAQKDFKAIGFEPEVIIEEPQVFAGGLGGGEVVALAIAFVLRMLNEAGIRKVRQEFASQVV